MKATEARLLDFIKKSPQFVIPIYQRTYSWTEKECKQLWDDVIRAGRSTQINGHFVGSIVYVEKGLYQVSNQSSLLVIDGQQRLTTITLLLAALVNKLESFPPEKQEIIDGFSPRKITHYYLVNPEENKDKYYKLILSDVDKDSLIAILSDRQKPKNASNRIYTNFNNFQKWIDENSNELLSLCHGIAKLFVVDIALSREQDNPQLIFESMNSTGKELTQADLIRNFILMGLDIQQQTELYENYWRPMEIDFGQDAYTTNFDGFMRHYLTVKTGSIPRVSEIYEGFKMHSNLLVSKDVDISEIVKDIKKYSQYYCSMALNKEEDPDLKKVFSDLRELKVDVAYPMLLEMYDDYKVELLTHREFLEIVRLIESYVFRRTICAIPTNSLNKIFSSFLKSVDKNEYVQSVKAQFILLPSYRRFPNDQEFKESLIVRDLYNIPRRSYWLRRIENFDRKERVEVDQYTIEHIMPQNSKLSNEWKQELGPEWERIQNKWLHTLGNLTLTAYNAEYSDKPFLEKRDKENGFKDSPIKLNQTLRNVSKWNESAIIKRANVLGDTAIKVWASTNLSEDVLEKYRQKELKREKDIYTLDNFKYIYPNSDNYVEKIGKLFELLSKQVLMIDPVIVQDFLKLYIAFKAETNFLDVVPQAKKLRLTLNMPFSEIIDPKGICRNVSDIGRWGNGDVEISFSEIEELPYIMSLIKQSFDRQISSDGTSE